MSKNVFVVGFSLPGDVEVEDVSYVESRSLLDADIVLFHPNLESFTRYETYKGKACLDDDESFSLQEITRHWNREIKAALAAGKTIFVIARNINVLFIATGERQFSGTGRNARASRIVMELDPYSVLPVELGHIVRSTGKRMSLTNQGDALKNYWHEFGSSSSYEMYFEGGKGTPLIVTQQAGLIVGSLFQTTSGGLLIVLPPPDLDDMASRLDESLDSTQKDATESKEMSSSKETDATPTPGGVDAVQEKADGAGENEKEYSAGETAIGAKFIGALIEIDRTLRSLQNRTPIPSWSQASDYELEEENILRQKLLKLETEIQSIETQKTKLVESLAHAGTLKGLLYETGHPLEDAIVTALRILGYQAQTFREGQSEFDALFFSPEGERMLGEAEGKDNRAISIEKLDQLERNVREEFALRETGEYAKGVLFGNAFRLAPIDSRGEFFTEKCVAAAKRSGAALVRTPDLFQVARYIKEAGDINFSLECRKCIATTSGAVVRFPAVPSRPKDQIDNRQTG